MIREYYFFLFLLLAYFFSVLSTCLHETDLDHCGASCRSAGPSAPYRILVVLKQMWNSRTSVPAVQKGKKAMNFYFSVLLMWELL